MNNELLPSNIVDIFQRINARLSMLESGSIGTVSLAGTITAYDPESGVKTVVGDLSQVGEERVGIAQFVGDTTPPPIPTAPIVEVSAGVVGITWDGANANNEKMAPDFDHFNVYGSSSGSTYLVGSIKNESEVAVYAGADGGTKWKFYLTSVDTNRNESGPSELSDEVTAINAGADPLVYDAIEALRQRISDAEALANAANQTAQTAQNKADDALKAALEGGIAKIVIDTVEPTAKEDGMVWVDTSKDPYVVSRWDSVSGSWRPVQDSAIATLALIAANAQKAAEQASAAAGAAMAAAGQAQSSANGKNNVYYVTALPGGNKFTVGDTAYIRSAVGEPITGQFQWDGSSWKSVTLNHQVISSVDLGKATVGELDGQYIKAQTITAKNMVLQNTDNMFNDPRFLYGNSTWSGLESWGSYANGVLKDTDKTTPYTLETPTPVSKLLVTPGEWYTFGFSASANKKTSLKYKSSIFWYDNSNTLIYEDVIKDSKQFDLGTTRLTTAKSSPQRAPINAMYAVPKATFESTSSGVSAHDLSVGNLTFTHAMNANLIVDGSITVDKIAANSITADKIIVGGVNNLFPDPTLASAPTHWDTPSNAFFGPSNRLGMVNSIFPSSRTMTVSSTKIGVQNSVLDGGVVLSVDVRLDEGVLSNLIQLESSIVNYIPLEVAIIFDNDGTIAHATVDKFGAFSGVSSTVFDYTSEEEWYNFKVKVPSSAFPVNTQNVYIYLINGTTVEITNVQLLLANSGTIIEDGTISSNHIESGSITTEKLVAGSVTSDIVSADVINGMAFNGVSFNGGSFTIYKDPTTLLNRSTNWLTPPVWASSIWKKAPSGYTSTPPAASGVGQSTYKLVQLNGNNTSVDFGVTVPVNEPYTPGLQVNVKMGVWLNGVSKPPVIMGNMRPVVVRPFIGQLIINTDKGSLTSTAIINVNANTWRAGYYSLGDIEFNISSPPGRKIATIQLMLTPGFMELYAVPYLGSIDINVIRANGELALRSDSQGIPGIYGKDVEGNPTVSLTSGGLTLPNDFTARTVKTTYPTNFGLYSAGVPIEVSRFGRMVQLTGAWKYTGTSASSDAITSPNEVVVMNRSLQADSTPLRNMTFINQGTGSQSWALTVKSDGTLCCSRYSGTLSASSNLIWLNFNVTYMI